MSILNFPTNPTVGQLHTIGSVTYVWSGSAWLISNTGDSTVGTVTATNGVYIGTGTSTVFINGQTVNINGFEAITTGSILSFFEAGDDININTSSGIVVISDTSNLQTVTDRGSSTTNAIYIFNTTTAISTTTGALVISGGVGIGGDLHVEGRVDSESLKIMDAIFDSTLILVNTTATTVIDSYSITQFRSAKYLVQVDEGMGEDAEFEVIEILLLVDNIGTVYATEYALLSTNGEMGEFAADVGEDNIVRLYFTPYFATDKSIKVLRTGMSV